MEIVSQQAILFNASFSDNIAFGVAKAEMNDIVNAARIANAHEFISESEGGYEYQVVNQAIVSVAASVKNQHCRALWPIRLY
jgi:ABC-type bacteriocin/lantibiotic exporter with double-glycine peptidase domain